MMYSLSTGARYGSGHGSIGFRGSSSLNAAKDPARPADESQHRKPCYGNRKLDQSRGQDTRPNSERRPIAGLPSYNAIQQLGKPERNAKRLQRRSVSSPVTAGVKPELNITGGRQPVHKASAAKIQLKQSKSFGGVETAPKRKGYDAAKEWEAFVGPRKSRSPSSSPPRISAIATLRPLSPESDSGMDDFAPAAAFYAAERRKVQQKAQQRAAFEKVLLDDGTSTAAKKRPCVAETGSKPAVARTKPASSHRERRPSEKYVSSRNLPTALREETIKARSTTSTIEKNKQPRTKVKILRDMSPDVSSSSKACKNVDKSLDKKSQLNVNSPYFQRSSANQSHAQKASKLKMAIHDLSGTRESKCERCQHSPELTSGAPRKRLKLSSYKDSRAAANSSLPLEASSSKVSRSRHCPQCRHELPYPLPAVVKERLRRVSAAVTSTARNLAIHELCTAHTAFSRTIPAGKAAGYPTSLDIPLIIKRTRSFFLKLLSMVVGNADSHFRNLAVKNGGHIVDADGDTKGRKRRQGPEARMHATADAAVGYYGPRGASAIASTLFDQFLGPKRGPPVLTSYESAPLTPIEFLQDVLVPEAARLLIMEDLVAKGLTEEQAEASALTILVDSAAYGAALFPEDDDSSDGMDSGSDF
ncbi:hypothetical protein BDZ88DRAFT_415852 [Geranomyces variabilis]|nr:hypothetical protein BDZ88DRAFT_415852 [Geranomyces variabilis]KAJ3141330.1 hypothetical protein HDU90_007357 [Geranomyces variabilis]